MSTTALPPAVACVPAFASFRANALTDLEPNAQLPFLLACNSVARMGTAQALDLRKPQTSARIQLP